MSDASAAMEEVQERGEEGAFRTKHDRNKPNHTGNSATVSHVGVREATSDRVLPMRTAYTSTL
eukprot:6317579-Pyramimonas_sp.AAC.1